ncbi:MAG: 3-isopropylmalate dehydrogenase [Alphaproteobacteria bacterium]
MKLPIVYLPGDGIGPEVASAGLAVLEAVAGRFGHGIEAREHLIGGAAIDAGCHPLPDETASAVKDCGAVLLGAVGGPKWDKADPRPEKGLLALRKALGLFANVRPVRPHPDLLDHSPIKADRLKGVDLVVVRELTGGLYFGDKARDADTAHDTCVYTRGEVDRVVRFAADLARRRRGRLTSVDKANVLETSRLWRAVTDEIVAADYGDVTLETLLVDAAAMHLINRPADFDVMVTENMFGDILTDEASMLAGSMGLLPSASLGAPGSPGLYEPIHGSAPDIAGRGIANPIGTILSVAMMLRHSFDLEDEAAAVESAVDAVITAGIRTGDLGGTATTQAVTAAVIAQVKAPQAAVA